MLETDVDRDKFMKLYESYEKKLFAVALRIDCGISMDSASYRYSRVWFENVIFPTSTLPVFKKRASYASCSLSLISTWFLFLCKVSPVRNVSSASIRNPHCRTSGLVSISKSNA